MVNISSIKSENIAIQINGLSNYLRQMNFTIKTLKYLLLDVSNSVDTRLLSETSLLNVRSAP